MVLEVDDVITVYICDGCNMVQVARPKSMSYHQRFTGEGARKGQRLPAGGWKAASAGKWVRCGPFVQRGARLIGMPGDDFIDEYLDGSA